MSDQVLVDVEEQLKIAAGRRAAPFTMVPEWVTVHPDLDPQAKALYDALAAHVNVGRADGKVWPTRLLLAMMLGWSREQSVDPYLRQLSKAGAITIDEDRRADGSLNRRPDGSVKKIYFVHETPPDDYTGPKNLAEFYAQARVKVQELREAKAAKKAAKKAAPASEQPADAPQTPPPAKKAAPARAAKAAQPAAEANAPTAPAAAPKPKPKPPRRGKDKTPEEIRLDQLADEGAHRWWDVEAPKLVAAKKMTSYLGDSQRGFLGVRTLIRQALAAKPNPYQPHQVMEALVLGAQWLPHRTGFERALSKVSGVRAAPSGTQRPRLYRDSQWTEGNPTDPATVPAQPPVPPDDEFAILDDDAR
ncbi:hypothetical protein ACIQ9R_36345 [Streptomyces sp. NPDC094447]|uniref:hypothetical protein n=1 Tax=Streptomyces sp. NPDC094447 TaxID=3366062 RepID=UPI00381C8B21